MTPPYPTSQSARARYTPGQTPTSRAFMAQRSIDTHGTHLLPWLEPGLTVLDLGCGPGTLTAGIADQVFPGRVIGVDARREPLENARRLAEGCELVNLSFTCASGYRLPFEAGTFDLVFAHALMEHVSDPLLLLREVRRVLAPRGRVVMASPDWDGFRFEQAGEDVLAVMRLYRAIQERNGGDTRAGQRLAGYAEEAGYQVLHQVDWNETYDSTLEIARYLAEHLESESEFAAARTLVRWSTRPGARFHQCWRWCVASPAENDEV